MRLALTASLEGVSNESTISTFGYRVVSLDHRVCQGGDMVFILSVNAYGSRTEVSVIEMDTQQGCEVAGNKLDGEVASNKLENIRNFSYTCI